MKVKVYDSGTTSCRALVHRIQCAITELGGQCVVEQVCDLDLILAAGIEETPAWAIGDEVMTTGILPSLEQIKADLVTHCHKNGGTH